MPGATEPGDHHSEAAASTTGTDVMSEAFLVRPATVDDLERIHAIFCYYVNHTVLSFLIHEPPLEYIRSRFRSVQEHNLPYLVAVESSSGRVVAYSSASPFRGHMLGYIRSVEMSIFCDPSYTSRGIGSILMQRLLKELESTKHRRSEASHEDQPMEMTVRNVLAIMAVDDEAAGYGLQLRDWYVNKWGFVQVGRLPAIGLKKNRELDTIYLMKDLDGR